MLPINPNPYMSGYEDRPTHAVGTEFPERVDIQEGHQSTVAKGDK